MAKFLSGGADALAVYVRQVAWLSAVPDLPQPSTGTQAPQKSRRQVLEEEGVTPEMPPLEWGSYLIDYLFELGPTMAAGMGAGPLMPSELEAAQRLLGVQFQPWEARLLLRLSREYLEEAHKATEQNCPAPWQDPETEAADRIATAKRLEQAMMQLIED